MTRILIVEDNPAFKSGAEAYLATRRDVEPLYANCYTEGHNHINVGQQQEKV